MWGWTKCLPKKILTKYLQALNWKTDWRKWMRSHYTDAKDKTQIGIEIHNGQNRIVRRIFEHLAYDVKGLDRVMYAGLTKKNVQRGKWRLLAAKKKCSIPEIS